MAEGTTKGVSNDRTGTGNVISITISKPDTRSYCNADPKEEAFSVRKSSYQERPYVLYDSINGIRPRFRLIGGKPSFNDVVLYDNTSIISLKWVVVNHIDATE